MPTFLRPAKVLLLTLFIGSTWQTARASDGDLSVADFQHTTWTAKDGAPADTWAIAQTNDGWLWFAGPNGLSRFDGIRFEKVEVVPGDSKLANAITSLAAIPSGKLLIGHRNGGVSALHNGQFTHFDTEQTRRAGDIQDFTEDLDGAIWATASGGLMRFDGQVWQLVGSEWNYPGGASRTAICDADGTLWISSNKGVLRLTRGGRRFEQVETEDTELAQSPDGKIWLLNPQTGVQVIPGQAATTPRGVLETSRKSADMFDNKGNFWSEYPYKVLPPASIRGVSSLGHIVRTSLEDREGNIWLGEHDAVVHRLRRPAIVKLPAAGTVEGLAPWTSLAIDEHGTVWMTRTSAGNKATFEVDGVWKVDGELQHVQANEIHSATAIARDANGKIWIGGRQGLWTLQVQRFVKAIDLPAAVRGEYVTGLTFDCSGGLWVSIRGAGLLRHFESEWQGNGGIAALSTGAPTAQTCDSSGRLWLGYGDGAVAIVDKSHATYLSDTSGLQIGSVTAINVGQHTVVGGERGLALLKGGHFFTLKSSIPAFEVVTGIVEASNGDIWLNSKQGLAHIQGTEFDRADLEQGSKISVELFDASDGYPDPGFSSFLPATTIARARDDRIWLAGVGGVAWIDPSNLKRDGPSPPTVITSLNVDNLPHDFAQHVVLPKGTRNLEINYAALNYSHPDRIRFRYRLDGADGTWVEAGARRQALYPNVAPGDYHFVVNASNENGEWTSSSASLDFAIPPTFVQSKLFLALCGAAALGLSVLLYKLRFRQITARERRRLADRLGERERIARELHDTLLQNTQGLILQFQAAANELPVNTPMRAKLDKALDRADTVMVEGRNRVLALRVPADTLRDLPDALAAAGEEISQGGTGKFRTLVEGQPRKLLRSVKDESYHIAREALFNAFRHAQADSVELQIVFSDESFRVRVRDDGTGIDSTALKSGSRPGHWGLPGMQERAQQIGARLNIWSQPGAGTEIELVVPAAVAYASSTTRLGRFSWRRIGQRKMV